MTISRLKLLFQISWLLFFWITLSMSQPLQQSFIKTFEQTCRTKTLFIFTFFLCSHSENTCNICLGDVKKSVKYCKTCRISYCEKHLEKHYKVRELSTQELVEADKLKSRGSQKRESSLQLSSSGKIMITHYQVVLYMKCN